MSMAGNTIQVYLNMDVLDACDGGLQLHTLAIASAAKVISRTVNKQLSILSAQPHAVITPTSFQVYVGGL